MMFDLSNTTIRGYKKKNGSYSLHLNSYLFINTSANFNLSAYLKEISAKIIIDDIVVFFSEKISYTCDCIISDNSTMIHKIWIEFILPGNVKLSNSIAQLELFIWISFTGHPSEEPELLKRKVIIERKYTRFDGGKI